MKKRITVLLIILSLTIILNGCQMPESKENSDPAEKNAETKLIQENSTDPRQNSSWTKIEEINVDLDGDSKEDLLGLYTAAERDNEGNLMWDDGQNWLLLVQSGDNFYPLLSEYVQLGNVFFTVSRYSEDLTTKVTVIVPTGANLRMVSYSYDHEKQGFIEDSLYNSEEDNFIFSSIPSYR